MKRKELAEIVVELCNKVLLKREQPKLPEMTAKNWNQVLSFASMQGVLPVITQLFADYEPENALLRGLLVKWYATSLENHQRYQLRTYNMRELAKLFEKEGLDIMFMKGATLAQLYPKPEWRVFSDIDYYLYGKSEQGIEAMAQHGIKNTDYYHHHTQASWSGILLENHYDFVERYNHKHNLALDDQLKKLAKDEGRTKKALFLGEDIVNAYEMTPTMNAIFLIRHMSAHFVSESIPLRMLYDWALFLKNCAAEVDWKLVMRMYESSGMMEFVGIVQGLLVTHFAVEFPECPVKPLTGEKTEKTWNSIVFPPLPNPYKRKNLPYFYYEAKVFVNNRWKHQIVYPSESYVLLFFKYAWLNLKRLVQMLNKSEQNAASKRNSQ